MQAPDRGPEELEKNFKNSARIAARDCTNKLCGPDDGADPGL